MAGIDDVLERLVTDAGFARDLAQDPAAALAGYELTQADLSLLSTQVSFDPGALSLVEERISKSSMFGLLTSLTGGLAGLGDAGAGQGPSPHMSPEPHMLPEPHMSPGVIAPIDAEPGQGTIGGGGEVYIKEVDPGAEAHGTGGGGGAGSEVSIKEVDPAPQPSSEADDTGGGGGAGGEVSIKEVDPGVPQDGGTQGIIIDTSVDNPDFKPGDSQGIIIDTSIDNPDIMPSVGGVPSDDAASPNIIVQGGTFPTDDPASPNMIVQGG